MHERAKRQLYFAWRRARYQRRRMISVVPRESVVQPLFEPASAPSVTLATRLSLNPPRSCCGAKRPRTMPDAHLAERAVEIAGKLHAHFMLECDSGRAGTFYAQWGVPER